MLPPDPLLRERDGFALFAVVRTEDGRCEGGCEPSLQVGDGVDEVEIGWHIRRDLWDRGNATEAALAVRDRVFDVLRRDRLIPLVEPSNAVSFRAAEKTGMHVERDALVFGSLHHVHAMTPGGG